MFQNKFNLLSIFGFFMLCISLFALAIAWQIYQDSYSYESERDYWVVVGFLSFGIIWLISSICLILKQPWVRVLFTIVFILGILVWAGLMLFTMSHRERFMPATLGASTLIFGSLIFGILFLNNRYVVEHFGEEYQIKENRDDILDF